MNSKALTNGDIRTATAMSGTQPRAQEVFEMPFAIGEVIAGKYAITELLGVGGVGFVVAAMHAELGQKVALKFLKPDMLANSQVSGRFAQEALAAVRIKSEHVARVFDVGSLDDGSPFIVMEFLEGRDLFDVITQDGPQPIRRAVDYVLQACEALADAHSCGVVHRDIKPENLFLVKRSEGMEVIKVLDFGISKLGLTGSVYQSKVPLVRTMLPVGSPVYMSPEQIRASKDLDQRTDIWSIGCVLHELLTGMAAFDAPSLTQLSAAILEQHPPLPSECQPGIPSELDAIVKKCLAKNPNERFQNIAELATVLYPYGPRRSRIHAERCCRLLKLPGTTHPEFELPSVRPPAFETASYDPTTTGNQIEISNYLRASLQEEIKTFRPLYRTKRFLVLPLLIAALALVAFAVTPLRVAILHWFMASVAEPSPGAVKAPAVLHQPSQAQLTQGNRPPESVVPSAVGVTASAVSPNATTMNALPEAAKAPLVKRPAALPAPRATKPKSRTPGGSSGADPDPGF